MTTKTETISAEERAALEEQRRTTADTLAEETARLVEYSNASDTRAAEAASAFASIGALGVLVDPDTLVHRSDTRKAWVRAADAADAAIVAEHALADGVKLTRADLARLDALLDDGK